MFLIFHFLLSFLDGCCTDDMSFWTKTVVVGEHVKLECSRRSAGEVFWTKISPGSPPEFINNNWSKAKVAYMPGILELHIADTSLHDTAFYICMRKKDGNILSRNLTYLIVKEPDVSKIPPSAPECSENYLTLLCSVLQDSQNKSCPSDENVFCFSAKSNDSNTNSSAENKGDAAVKDFCLSSFFKKITSSDDLKYYCAVPKCEEKIQKKDSSSHSEANMWNSYKADPVRNILIAALVGSQILIVFLLILVKKLKTESKSRSSDAVLQQIHNHQKNEDLLVYSAPSFSRKKSSKKQTRGHDDDKEETTTQTIYANIAVHEL